MAPKTPTVSARTSIIVCSLLIVGAGIAFFADQKVIAGILVIAGAFTLIWGYRR